MSEELTLNVEVAVQPDPRVARAIQLSLSILEVLVEESEDYTTTFNALSMAAISLIIPFMQDNNIPVTPENVNAQLDRLVANMSRARDFVITNSPYIQGANNERENIPG